MEENTNDLRARDYVVPTIVLATSVYGAYQLGRQGVMAAREGVQALKTKKSNKKN